MNDDVEKPTQLAEPSVLDYVKSLFRFGNGERIQLPSDEIRVQETVKESRSFTVETPLLEPVDELKVEPAVVQAPSPEPRPIPDPAEEPPVTPFPWRSLLALIVALIGQQTFE